MKNIIVVALVAVLIFVGINDLGRFLIGMYTLDDTGRAAVAEADRINRQNPSSNSGWPAAWQVAQEKGVEILGYRQDSTGVVAVVRIWIGGTFLLGPAHALLTRQPLTTPFPLQQTVRSR